MDPEQLKRICRHFDLPGIPESFKALGKGKIQETWLTRFSGQDNIANRFVLQRINPHVFPDAEVLMHNMESVLSHLAKKGKKGIKLKRTLSGHSFFREDLSDSAWRMYDYIEPVMSFDRTENEKTAFEAGRILGEFHAAMDDFQVALLKPHLPDFHNTCLYYQKLVEGSSSDSSLPRPWFNAFEFIQKRRTSTTIMEESFKKGFLERKVCHNDPKLANILFEEGTGRALCLIDFDTLGIGFIPNDFGDAARSVCCLKEMGDIRFSLDFFRSFCVGYVNSAPLFSLEQARDLLFDGLKTMALELSIRYLLDYRMGGIHFTNLSREAILENALKQQRLLSAIEESEPQARQILRDCTKFPKVSE